MTDPNRPNDDAVKPAQTGEPVVSKPYIMPDDPEEGSNEALTKEAGRGARQDAAHAGGNGKPAQAHRGARWPMPRPTASPASRATCSISPTICSARSTRFRPRPRQTADPGLKALIEGVELTERSLLNTLEKNGVKKFDPSGEKFDPELPAGDVRSARSVGSGRHGGPGRAGRLHDRRARAAPGAGRGLQGRRQGRAGGRRRANSAA